MLKQPKSKIMEWRKFNGELIRNQIAEQLYADLVREVGLGNKIKVCIGSDSQVKGKVAEFANVVVILREKKGGFMYYQKYKTSTKMSIKERMITEVNNSVQLAYELCPILDAFGVALEVHADINTDPNFKSNTALKEAMGYILGMGYVFKAKPDAFASSYCADRLVH